MRILGYREAILLWRHSISNLFWTRSRSTEADALYAHCKDGTLITAAGVTFMDFDRQAGSLDQAVRSAIADINAAGFGVTRIEIEADRFMPQQA